ncbi:hypothetical protein GGR28_001104 [Lewinella aquimaris]|uniref:Membrane protein DUF2207 n=1 Tax=Neolewinella aquimaris TaxID=1835722 RepID=A0A840DZS2_9BACT|nr:DUF2207 domain-containing protein [Neolewinella aquimaris]MBB4078491.1 hypothetical protein [Neolewinella aquimaris]
MRVFLFLTLWVLLVASAPAQERFLEWHSDVTPQPDRSIKVVETIKVAAEGDVIKRGITRSLPERDDQPVTVQSVERDGREEAFHTQSKNRELTIYAGRKEVLLDPGTYTYRITYRIENAIGRVDSLDELDFELTGPDVSLPIERLSAGVTIPPAATVLQSACYTGATGSTQRNCRIDDSGNQLRFTADGRYGNGKSMSIAVGFQSGYFTAPLPTQSVVEPPRSWLEREGSVLFLLLGALAYGYYFYSSWKRHGVDPPAPRVGAVYAPPEEHSPAAIGYLSTAFGTIGPACFTASLLDLARRGHLFIEPVEERGFLTTETYYRLRANPAAPATDPLPAEQSALLQRLFSRSDEVTLKESYDSQFKKVLTAHDKALRQRLRDYHRQGNNATRILPLVGIFALSLVAAVPFLGTDATGFALPALVVFAIAGLIGFVAYVVLIRQPSPEQVALRTRIDAFREYLSMSESKRRRLPGAPTMTPEHYEDLLPYAIALGIHTKWTEYFGDLLSDRQYRPTYLVGNQAFVAGDFSRRFSTVVRSSSTPVQSSSSGGGGSVGGGSGGGGAGGW